MASGYTGAVNKRMARALRRDVQAYLAATGDRQGDVAEALGIKPATLSNYLNGRWPVPMEVGIEIARLTHQEHGLEEYERACADEAPVTASARTVYGEMLEAEQLEHERRRHLMEALEDGRITAEEAEAYDALASKAIAKQRLFRKLVRAAATNATTEAAPRERM